MNSSTKRIIKNTLMLYFRQMLVMLVGLYTVRVVLNTLGVLDYGIYNVVAGVVAMLTFLTGSMAHASQRFLAFEIGRGDFERLKKTFAVNWSIYGLIVVIALILLESLGLWFVNDRLVIPPERFEAAHWVYQYAIFSFLCAILTVPYTSAVIAHEDMHIFAWVSLLDAFLKLGIVFVLQIVPMDKLHLYGILLCSVSIFHLAIYRIICHSRYKECRISFCWDKTLFKEVAGFTGWSLFGQITVVFRNQAVTILLNQTFNPAVVAARSIANQVASTISSFSSNFNTGLYPPIVKSYSSGQKDQMIKYIFFGAKATFFLMLLFSLPLTLEMSAILPLWLKNPPEYAVLFAQLAVMDGLINSVSHPLMTAARATGKVRLYELSIGSILLASFFVSWMVLYWGASPYGVMYVAIGASVLMFFVRLWIVRKLVRFSLRSFFTRVVIPLLSVTVLSCLFAGVICWSLPDNLLFLCIKLIIYVFLICVCVWFAGITSQERIKVYGLVQRKFVEWGMIKKEKH